MKEEYILCAANWYKELPLKDDEWIRMRGISPDNTDSGIVLCGWRHANIIAQMNAITGLRQCEAGKEVQGFLTNKNRFVDRIEGLAIAIKANQTTKTDGRLYSEDLY